MATWTNVKWTNDKIVARIFVVWLKWWRDMVPKTICPETMFLKTICPGDNVPRRQYALRQSAPETICPGDNLPRRQPAPGDNMPLRQSAPETTCPETMFPGDIMPRRQFAPVSKYIIGTRLC